MKKIIAFVSVSLLLLAGEGVRSQETVVLHPDVIRVASPADSLLRYMVQTEAIYSEGLDTLPQTNFWEKVMTLSPDSGLVSLACNRNIYCCMAVADWKKLGQEGQDRFRDSLRNSYCISDSTSILFTSGKSDFYNVSAAIPEIDRAIPIFVNDGVDPFYAQAILLIESPGKSRRSYAGAVGSFQLMRGVAVHMGLKVNKYVDERKDFDKSAWAAAELIKKICIPYTNAMLDERGITYNESDLWYRLLVLHVYHAGAGNVEKVLNAIDPCDGGIGLIEQMWETKAGHFGTSSQNYSQLALAALIQLDEAMGTDCPCVCPVIEDK